MAGHPEELVLASASPRRRELLERMGLCFRVRPASVAEDNEPRKGALAMVAANAALKAEALWQTIPSALLLGSDTTVALAGSVLNKPVDRSEARTMLRRLSGRSHQVHTAVALRWAAGGLKEDFVVTSQVRFKRFDAATIEAYMERVDPLDKAGAYGIQQAREMIIESVDGSVENVMGLPIQELARKFDEHGFDFRVEPSSGLGG